ncbi:MAG: hypothetical protein LC797_07660 [Chloroflexi bacterium]|nr:hypothetical protein [Chloroflexota bacterium]
MFWRSFDLAARRATVAFALLVGALPLASPTLAAELIVDNSDNTVVVKGKWTNTSTTGGFVGSDYLFRTAGDGSSSVSWPLPPGAAGRYEVFARWSAGPNRATNANYQVTSNAGGSNVPANQKVNGGSWQSLGSFDFQSGKGQGVTITDKADGVVVADAIRFVGPLGGAPPASAPPQPTPAPAQQTAVVPASAPSPVPNDARLFQQTGYRIGEDAFWDYFRVRGGVRSFGYPVSNVFTLFGMKVQIFQRQILQLRPDGGVQTQPVAQTRLAHVSRADP